MDICASEYTAADHAEKQNLYKLNHLINEIRQGKRKAGQSLTLLNIPNYVTKSAGKDQESKAEQRVGIVVLRGGGGGVGDGSGVLEKLIDRVGGLVRNDFVWFCGLVICPCIDKILLFRPVLILNSK